MRRMANVYQQGDVVLKETDVSLEELTEDTSYQEKAEKLIVEGSQGHKHTMEAPVYERKYRGNPVVVVSIPTDLTHPQHRTLVIRPGVYEVYHVRDALGGRGGD